MSVLDAMALAVHIGDGHRWHRGGAAYGPDLADRELGERILAALRADGFDVVAVSPDHPSHPWKVAAREGRWEDAERLLRASQGTEAAGGEGPE